MASLLWTLSLEKPVLWRLTSTVLTWQSVWVHSSWKPYYGWCLSWKFHAMAPTLSIGPNSIFTLLLIHTVLNCHDFLSIINCHVTTAVVDWEWVSENMINILNRFWYFGQPIITILRNSNATLGCRKQQKSNLTIFSYAWMQKNNLNYSMSSVSRGCFQNYNENNVKI